MDFFCLLFLTTKLKPSGFPAVPELCPMCCVGAGLGGHLPPGHSQTASGGMTAFIALKGFVLTFCVLRIPKGAKEPGHTAYTLSLTTLRGVVPLASLLGSEHSPGSRQGQ